MGKLPGGRPAFDDFALENLYSPRGQVGLFPIMHQKGAVSAPSGFKIIFHQFGKFLAGSFENLNKYRQFLVANARD